MLETVPRQLGQYVRIFFLASLNTHHTPQRLPGSTLMSIVLVVSCRHGQSARRDIARRHTEVEVVSLAVAQDHNEANDVVERCNSQSLALRPKKPTHATPTACLRSAVRGTCRAGSWASRPAPHLEEAPRRTLISATCAGHPLLLQWPGVLSASMFSVLRPAGFSWGMRRVHGSVETHIRRRNLSHRVSMSVN
jgi:hypothetical protein